jgi:hypothetical protein
MTKRFEARIYLDLKALALDPGTPEDLGVLPLLVGEELA